MGEDSDELRELRERVTRLEAAQEVAHKLLLAEITGYVRGQLDSVNENINAVHRDLLEKLTDHEKDGGRKVAGILVFSGIAAAILATLLAERFGFITKLAGP